MNNPCDISSIVIGRDNNGELCLWKSYVGINETFILLYWGGKYDDSFGYGDLRSGYLSYSVPTWKCLNYISVDDAWRYPSVNIVFLNEDRDSIYHVTPATEIHDSEYAFRGIGFTYITTQYNDDFPSVASSNEKYINFIWLNRGGGQYPYRVYEHKFQMKNQMDLKVISETESHTNDNTIYFIKEQ